MAIKMTGRVADGIILQLGDPDLIRWFVGQLREAAAEAGRDPGALKVQAAAPAHVGPARARARAYELVPRPRLATMSWTSSTSTRASSCPSR